VTKDREQAFSEFVDAWNAGKRPDLEDYAARVPEDEHAEFAADVVAFMALADTPAYSEADMRAIESDPALVAALSAAEAPAQLLPALLARVKARLGMSTDDVATGLLRELDLPAAGKKKAAVYLDRLERGDLEPTRVSRRVFDALARLFRMPASELEGAADFGAWSGRGAVPAAAPVFRADEQAAAAISDHLDLLADAVEAPGGKGRDEIDDLFVGGR
jgi:hypothetical protein